MHCLLFLVPLTIAGYPPFTEDELPTERIINIWKPTGGEKVYYPIHFGPAGTKAWESIILSFSFFNRFDTGFFDCFCGGDEFIMHIDRPENPTINVTVTPDNYDPHCGNYSEDVDTCKLGQWWAHTRGVPLPPSYPFFNYSFTVTNSPYGGGIAYFWYATY